MATSLQTCNRMYAVVRNLQQNKNLSIHARNVSFFERFRKKPKELSETKDKTGDTFKPGPGLLTHDRLQILKKRTGVQTTKGYKPPDDVEEKLKDIFVEVYGEKDNWKNLALSDRHDKFQFLSQAIKKFDHDVPNMVLTNITKVQDVVSHFKTEVKETSSLEDLSRLNLPKNLHMNLEYIRFDRETDTLFGGQTAYPGRPTNVRSLKYSRKYKGTSKQKKK